MHEFFSKPAVEVERLKLGILHYQAFLHYWVNDGKSSEEEIILSSTYRRCCSPDATFTWIAVLSDATLMQHFSSQKVSLLPWYVASGDATLANPSSSLAGHPAGRCRNSVATSLT